MNAEYMITPSPAGIDPHRDHTARVHGQKKSHRLRIYLPNGASVSLKEEGSNVLDLKNQLVQHWDELGLSEHDLSELPRPSAPGRVRVISKGRILQEAERLDRHNCLVAPSTSSHELILHISVRPRDVPPSSHHHRSHHQHSGCHGM
ncbi:Ubiquitin-2 like Rad60 SUMO-like [Carpediemonas membranifera]|uniref:Ubiquitin-2 like Rad60 SUMO-like n=1 Tax=Carpediemonas membranifera TaxID=201153 RepID=A0A8J6AVW1_9EUKA|nr:Ubiquitin-2 like Rad60 SUMO-like [Carpediemonas membranifera]|eukprot:KAG9389538.1 Ubiquitin-2 like Rad60 SUMO-like [Carpediemonas membranifera]